MAESTWAAELSDLVVRLQLTDGKLWWSAAKGGVTLTQPRPISLRTADGTDLMTGLSFASSSGRTVEETYELAVGKRTGTHRVEHQERSVRLLRSDGRHVTVVLRAAHDGVALRTVLEGASGLRLRGSDVSLRLPESAAVWPLTYTPWYETTRFTSTLDALEAGEYGLPFLAQVGDETYLLMSESDLDGRYGGSFVRYDGRGELAFTLADDVEVAADAVATPWRVLIAGDLATIVASHLVDDLAEAADNPVPAWVRPGRAGWSWWSDFYSGAHLDKQLRLLDYAAQRGWEYLLVDCGWDAAWMPELVSAASKQGIGVFVWVSWDHLRIHTQLAEWASWGVAGIKVDFMESEAQERYRWYDAVIAECNRA